MGIVVGIAALLVTGLVWRVVANGPSEEVATELRVSEPFAIASLPENVLGRVHGVTKRQGGTVRASLTGRECLYFIVRIEKLVHDGRRSYWQTIATDSDHVPFLVDDGTGQAIVDPLGARAAMRRDSQSGTVAAKQALIQKYSIIETELRFRETIIAEHEKIVVAGAAVREPVGEPGYRDPATRLTFRASTVFALALSNIPRLVRRG
jgi:hypothetical protein